MSLVPVELSPPMPLPHIMPLPGPCDLQGLCPVSYSCPFQAHVGLFHPMLLPPLTSTLMSPLPGSQEMDYQLQNRFSIPEPILNSKTDSKLWKLI